jgi:hypothetical protein
MPELSTGGSPEPHRHWMQRWKRLCRSTQPFFMCINVPPWVGNSLGCAPVTRGHPLKANKALRGHPKAPRLWRKHIDKNMTKEELGFQATTHETCLHHKLIHGNLVLVLRQVDGFSIALVLTRRHCGGRLSRKGIKSMRTSCGSVPSRSTERAVSVSESSLVGTRNPNQPMIRNQE